MWVEKMFNWRQKQYIPQKYYLLVISSHINFWALKQHSNLSFLAMLWKQFTFLSYLFCSLKAIYLYIKPNNWYQTWIKDLRACVILFLSFFSDRSKSGISSKSPPQGKPSQTFTYLIWKSVGIFLNLLSWDKLNLYKRIERICR